MRNTLTTTVFLLFFVLNAFGQSIHMEDGIVYTTIENSKAKKTLKEEVPTRSATCSGFIYEQDISLTNFAQSGGAISDNPQYPRKGYDDFTLNSTSTINTIIATIGDFDPACSSPEFIVNFRSNGSNGSYGSILHSRTVAADAATYTKDCIIERWNGENSGIYNLHIPISPVTLTPGTYWLEIYSPNQASLLDGVFWQWTSTVSGSPSIWEDLNTGQNINSANKDFAFALSSSTDMPTSACVPAIEAVCQNTSVTLGQGGTASISASDVDGGSSGFTNISVSPSTFNCDNLGANSVTLTVDDGAGNSDDCTATVTVLDDQGLPNSWEAYNIGTAPSGNTFNFDACNGSTVSDQFVIGGGGNNAINLMSDNIAFASQTLCGDGSITAKIENVDATGYGGLMIRETTAAGSKQVSVFSNMTSQLRYEARTMTNMPKSVQSFFKPSPIWLKMVRQGMWIHVSYSSNGMMFSPVQSTMVSMSSCVEIGLASFTFLPMGQTTATFSSVSTTGNIQDVAGSTPTAFAVDTPELAHQNGKIGNDLTLFPNPTSHQFTLQLDSPLQEEAMVEVINLYGQSMATQRLAAGQHIQNWNVADWPVGTYLMRLNRAGQAPKVKQFVVSR